MISKKQKGGLASRLLVGLALLVLVVALAVPLLISRLLLDAEWVDSNLLPAVEARLGRRLKVDELDFKTSSLWLRGVSLSEDPDWARDDGPFLQVDEVRLGINLAALLEARLEIDSLSLSGLTMTLRRSRSGELNTDSLSRPPSIRAGDNSDRQPPSGGASVSLQLKQLVISDSHILLLPPDDDDAATVSIERARWKPAHGAWPLEATGTLLFPGGPRRDFELRNHREKFLRLSGLDLERIAAFATAWRGDLPPQLPAPAPGEARLELGKLSWRGLEMSRLSGLAVSEAGRLRIRGLTGSVAGGTLDGAADLFPGDKPDRYSGKLLVRDAEWASVATAVFGPGWASQPGKLTADLGFEGSLGNDLALAVELDLDRLDLVKVGEWSREWKGELPLRRDPREVPITARGNFRAGAVILPGLQFEQASGRAEYGRGVLRVYEAKADLYGGSLGDLTAHVDFSPRKTAPTLSAGPSPGPAWKAAGKLTGADIKLAVQHYLPPSWGTLEGVFNLEGSVSGGGTGEELRTGLRADASLAVPRARFRDSAFMKDLARRTGIAPLAELEMVDSGGDFQLRDGRVHSPLAVFGNSVGQLALRGSVGFDTSMDFDLWIGIGPGEKRELLSAGILMPYLKDTEGWTYVPVSVSGDFEDPGVAVHPRAVVSTVLNVIPDAAGRILTEGSEAAEVLPGGKLAGKVVENSVDLATGLVAHGTDGLVSVVERFGKIIGVDVKKPSPPPATKP